MAHVKGVDPGTKSDYNFKVGGGEGMCAEVAKSKKGV